MTTNYKDLDPSQLLTACGILESTLIHLIRHYEKSGVDTGEARRCLNQAHRAVNGLKD